MLEDPESLRSQQLFTPERKNHSSIPMPANVVISPHKKRKGNDTDISHWLELLLGHFHLVFHHFLTLVFKFFQHIGILGKLCLPEFLLENPHAFLSIPHEFPVN